MKDVIARVRPLSSVRPELIEGLLERQRAFRRAQRERNRNRRKKQSGSQADARKESSHLRHPITPITFITSITSLNLSVTTAP